MGRLEVARLLLEHSADVNARDDDGWTPLHFAAYNDHVDVAELLLRHGADAGARDNEGLTPLDVALRTEHAEVARVIEEYSKGKTRR